MPIPAPIPAAAPVDIPCTAGATLSDALALSVVVAVTVPAALVTVAVGESKPSELIRSVFTCRRPPGMLKDELHSPKSQE